MSLNETFRMHETKLKKLFILFFIVLAAGIWQSVLAQNQVALLPKDAAPKASTIYSLKFSLDTALPTDAAFVLQFDSAFDLSNVEIAGSSTINGGFELRVEGQKLTISRTGLGEAVPSNKKVGIKFALVKNPDQAGNDFPVDIEINGGDAGVLLKKRVFVSIK